MKGPERVQGPPDRAEHERDRYQADPDQDVDEAEDRVGQPVHAEQQRHHRVSEGGQTDQPDDPAEPARVDRPGDCGWQRFSGGVAAVPRFPPGQAEDDERQRDRDCGATDRQTERHRQILPPTDPVQRKEKRCDHETTSLATSLPLSWVSISKVPFMSAVNLTDAVLPGVSASSLS